MKAIKRIINKAQQNRKRIILSEAQDPRVLAAARMAVDRKIAHITLVGDKKVIRDAAKLHQVSLAGVHIVLSLIHI